MVPYCCLNPWGQVPVWFQWKCNTFYTRNWIPVRPIKYQPCCHGVNVLINTGLIHDFKSALILLCSCHLYNSKGTVLLSTYTFALDTLILIYFINSKSSLNPEMPFISEMSENFRMLKFVEPNASLLAQYLRHMSVILSRVTGNSTMCSTDNLD